ncbi:MAG: phenylacetate-CoA oxygenase/reductase subunit PaaK [Bacteroidia bacterium]|nr:phenylacetate-CoA oxygenase/reductase subunit PaaK [Bacteroidia bacterium]
MTPKFHTLKIKDIRRETADCISVSLDVPAELKLDYTFIQGQYLTFKVNMQGQELRRSYSICTSPSENELRVAIKEMENGLFSTYANKNFKAGDSLDVMTPTGLFYTQLDATQSKNYCSFASGSGITPIMSIMKSVLYTEPGSTFTLFYGNKNSASIIFHEEIEALKNKFMGRLSVYNILSRETVDIPLLNGRIDSRKCKECIDAKVLDPTFFHEYFLCGPESMILSVKDILVENGVDKKLIHFELFTTPTQTAIKAQEAPKTTGKTADKTSNVSVKIDGITYTLDLLYGGDTILDAAIAKGADLPYACKGGVCCTCRAKVTKGTVEMEMNFALEDDEIEKGYVLTCQAHPTSEEVFIDFDIK